MIKSIEFTCCKKGQKIAVKSDTTETDFSKNIWPKLEEKEYLKKDEI